MRAPFDRLITLYWGPGTVTPGVVRIAELPARVVPDLVFIDQAEPLSESLAYFTCDAWQPFGPDVVDIASGIWVSDYNQSDRVGLTAGAEATHYVQRVELRTRPGSASYWRAYIAPIPSPPVTPCQSGYGEQYTVTEYLGPYLFTVARIGPTTWTETSRTLEAETGPVDPDNCTSTWKLYLPDGTLEGYWDGQGTYIFFESVPPFRQYDVTRVP